MTFDHDAWYVKPIEWLYCTELFDAHKDLNGSIDWGSYKEITKMGTHYMDVMVRDCISQDLRENYQIELTDRTVRHNSPSELSVSNKSHNYWSEL